MDRNAIARAAFQAGQKFKRLNGAGGVAVPEHLATGGEGNQNIAVAVVTQDQVGSGFAMALAAMEYMIGRMGLNFFLFGLKGNLPAEQRNVAVANARLHKCGWLLLVDAHCSFAPNALARIWNAAQAEKLDIVGASVAERAWPHPNAALGLGEGVQAVSTGPLVEVAAIPAAFMLVRVSVFDKLRAPYFRHAVIEEGEPGGPALFDDGHTFCHAARAAGFKVWLDVELSQYVVNWGECGFRLTGSDDPAKQWEHVEVGMAPTHNEAAAAAANEGEKAAEPPADGPKIEVAR